MQCRLACARIPYRMDGEISWSRRGSLIFDTQKKKQAIFPLGSIIEMLHRHSQMTCEQCLGACVSL